MKTLILQVILGPVLILTVFPKHNITLLLLLHSLLKDWYWLSIISSFSISNSSKGKSSLSLSLYEKVIVLPLVIETRRGGEWDWTFKTYDYIKRLIHPFLLMYQEDFFINQGWLMTKLTEYYGRACRSLSETVYRKILCWCSKHSSYNNLEIAVM